MRYILILLVAACGAQTLKVEPVKVEPIHMTIDVNIHDDVARTQSVQRR